MTNLFEIGKRTGQIAAGNRAGEIIDMKHEDGEDYCLIRLDAGGEEWMPQRTLVLE